MKALWNRLRWPALLVAALLLVFAAGLIRPGVFNALGVHPLKPLYSDLIAILAAGEAQEVGRDPYEHNPLDPFNRPHVYGPWWLVTGDLGLVRSDAWWLGSLLATAIAVVGARLLSPRGKGELFAAGALLISPPVLLAMERANNDLVMLLLLAGAAWLTTRRSWIGGAMGGALLLTAAALKLYPIAALPAMAARATTRKRAMAWVAATALVVAGVTLASLATYRMIAAMAPEPLTIFGYGAKLTYYVFLTIPDERLWLTLGALPVLAAAGWLAWKHRGDLWQLVPATGFDAACYLAGALCWSFCYVSTISFSYRMVLLLLPARLWLAVNSNPASRLQLGATIALVWTPWLKEHLLVLNAEESQFTGPPTAWIALGVEHATALMLTLLIMVSLAGWGWRRFISAAENQGAEPGSRHG